jgi:type I restriction enzyme M protein
MKSATKPTSKEIANTVWSACDTFRGTLDPTMYKDYVLAFLFFKYVSDVYKAHKQQLEEQYNDPKLVKRKLKRERFVIPDGHTFDDIKESRIAEDSDLGDQINKALAAIENENPEKLTNVFRDVDFNSEANLGETKERNRRLRNMIDKFDTPKLDFQAFADDPRGEDIIGRAYMRLIGWFASDAGKKGGEFYTPAEVSETIAKIIDPQPGERIYDPTIGSGSLAIEAAGQVGSDDFAIYGQEANRMTWALAKMNMFLHGIDGATIRRGDTIGSPKLKEGDALMKFDVVVANPPFSLKDWGKDEAKEDEWGRFDSYSLPPKNRGDYAFLLHMVHSAREGTGRVASVVPHGVLFRGGAEGRNREKLVQQNLLDAVIGLPEGLFFGTPIPTALMVFRKDRTERGVDDVLFIDASEHYREETGQNVLRDEDVQRIVEAYWEREDRDKFAYVASPDEIAENDYNLNIPRYVDTFEPEDPVDLEEVQEEIDRIEKELSETSQTLDKHLQELGLPA